MSSSISPSPLFKKLKMKAGQKILVLHAPTTYFEKLGQLPENTKLFKDLSEDHHSFSFIQLFIKKKAELDTLLPRILPLLESDSLLWLCYPKVSSNISTDIHRDKGWESLKQAGYEGVAMVAIDETWSALRFKKTPHHQSGVLASSLLSVSKQTPLKKRLPIKVPSDFKRALQAKEKAWEIFEGFAYTHRKEYVQWIETAKKPETRLRRIQKAVEKIAQGEKYS